MKGNIRKLIGFLTISALLLASIVVVCPVEAHAPGIVLHCGFGTPTIDGVMSPGEWSFAGHHDFTVNTPNGGTTPGTVFAMNDANNLYLAIRFARAQADTGNSGGFEFDNDNGGGTTVIGDDVLIFNPNPAVGFWDEFRSDGLGTQDTADGGTNDGAGAFSNDGTYSVYEFSHPLDTADNAHDFSLHPGDTVGFNLFIRTGADAVYADTDWPSINPLNADSFGDIVTRAEGSPSVPGISLLGIGAMVLLLGCAVVWVIRRRQIRSGIH